MIETGAEVFCRGAKLTQYCFTNLLISQSLFLLTP